MGLKKVLDEINEVINNPKMHINQKEYDLEFYLGGDYKVSFIIMCSMIILKIM